MNERQSYSPVSNGYIPERVLVIRFHALGDISITFPCCSSLRQQFPTARIDYLTSEDAVPLVEALTMFSSIHTISRAKTPRERFAKSAAIGWKLRANHYDVVVDLQRNWMSRLIRRLVNPHYWSEFDRYSLKLAGERVITAFHALGLTQIKPSYTLEFNRSQLGGALTILKTHGWNGGTPLIVLNPAGLWETRNWPLQNYIELSRLWLQREHVQFLILGTNALSHKALSLKQALGNSLISLVDATNVGQAFAVLQHSSIVISEDSGLMHMAWTSGIPTVALLGSTRHQWSSPMGEHTHCFHSGDLPCGACMEATCRFSDVHCLTRYTPEIIFEQAQQILATQKKVVHSK
jgi:heptosyltransferase-2